METRALSIASTEEMPFMMHFKEKDLNVLVVDGSYDDELQVWVPNSANPICSTSTTETTSRTTINVTSDGSTVSDSESDQNYDSD